MNSKIALFLVGAIPLMAHSATPSPLMEELGRGTKVLAVDLSHPLPKDVQGDVWKLLQAEKKTVGPTSLRREEIDLGLGLIELDRGNEEKALVLFQGIPPSALLKDVAIYYEAKTRRSIGEKALAKGRSSTAESSCQEAEALLRDLDHYPPGPYANRIPEEVHRARACYGRAFVALKKFDAAYPLLLALLQDPLFLTEEDQEFFLVEIIKILHKWDRKIEGRLLLDEAQKTFPQNQALKKLDQKWPKAGKNDQTPLPQELESTPKPPLPFQFPAPREVKEKKLFSEAMRHERKGRGQKAARLYVKIQRDYPGSTTARRAGSKLRSLVDNEASEKNVPTYLMRELKKLPPQALYPLARHIWEFDLDHEAETLFKVILKEDPTSELAGTIHYFLGRIAENRKDWKKARTHFKKVVEGFSASTFYNRSLFKVGWLAFLSGNDKEAKIWLEYDLAENQPNLSATRSLYWLSKTFSRMKLTQKAEIFRTAIPRLGPLSYYVFLSDQFPVFRDEKTPTAFPESRQSFWNHYFLRRARSLLASGLPRAAVPALKKVTVDADPRTAEELAQLFHHAGFDRSAIVLANNLQRKHPAPHPKLWFDLIFPQAFQKEIETEAKANGLDPLLLLSLIKQESAFDPEAESSAGASGLMQLMPATARQVARKIGVPVPKRKELLISTENIRLGARYLHDLAQRFEGNIIFALAAYNAGPSRVSTWVKRWKDLPPEVFIELIPYNETRGYVKSIIRNYFFYTKTLNEKTLKLNELTNILGK